MVLETIRVGLTAKSLLSKIFETHIRHGEYAPSSSGIFKDGDCFVAFDNRTNDCWVEEFNDINSAFEWVKG